MGASASSHSVPREALVSLPLLRHAPGPSPSSAGCLVFMNSGLVARSGSELGTREAPRKGGHYPIAWLCRHSHTRGRYFSGRRASSCKTALLSPEYFCWAPSTAVFLSLEGTADALAFFKFLYSHHRTREIIREMRSVRNERKK